jgi:3-dehydroquinate dehydratase-2
VKKKKPAAAGKRAAAAPRTKPTKKQLRILVLSGPNLQLLGTREPAIYGKETLDDVHRRVETRGAELGVVVETFQTNHEGTLLDRIGAAKNAYDGILLNGGALTHTSLALYDAIRAVGVPTVEVHISNPEAREEFRHESKIAPACIGKVSGFGGMSYMLALDGLVLRLTKR